jgi:hypothetical protein
MINVIKFKNELIDKYKYYNACVDILNKSNDDYIDFLFLHLTKNICFKISKSNQQNIKKILIDKNNNYNINIIKLYGKYLLDEEKDIISKGSFDVYFYIEKYPKKKTKEYYFFKNRRDFLIPCFLHNKTIEFLELLNITNSEIYFNRLRMFFDTIKKLRTNFKTIDRLGILVDGSATLTIHNVRKMEDLDLIIYHPDFKTDKIKKKLFKIHKESPFIDAYFHNVLSWDGEDKKVLDKQVSFITNNKITDFYYVPFTPSLHYYFYGTKIILLNYNLRYRAMRHYPKNIADLIITRIKLNINVPKINKLGDFINANNEKMYDKQDFIRIMIKYLDKFGYKMNYDKVMNELELITK